ncbi:MAG: PAS domain-containing methyl-accepting chemotaxis protein [Treponema sp.]|nr:PAS domain-containing methyl-accepting chemotaxis protein [Treponema sp.]
MRNTMNSVTRFHKLARQDKSRQITVVIIMAVLNLLIFVVGVTMQNTAFAMNVFVPVLIVTNVCLSLLIARLTTEYGKKSFNEGLRLVIDSIPMVSSLIDKNGDLLYCNDEAHKLFSLQDKQEYMDNWYNIMPELQPDGTPSQERLDNVIKSAFRNGKERIELMQKKLNGEPVPCEFILVRASLYGNDYLFEFTRDLREDHEMRKREAGVKERMKAILDSAPMVCALFDETDAILDVNREVKNLFGITDEKTYIDNFNDFLPPLQPDGTNSIQKSSDMLKLAMRDGSARYEWLYQRQDGTPIPTEEIGQRITVDGKNLVICYTRDLREFYANKEKDIRVQQNIQTMIEQLNVNVTEQAAAVTESAAAIEEMVASIKAVTNALSINADKVKELQAASRVGHDGINDVVADIRGIAKESESLLEINSVMENIASQTDLLSMNAAIEAAHAGESGRGFAVVAEEIRKLAESSSEQSKTIGLVLKTIKDSIDKITRSTETVLNRFQEIDSGIKTVAEQEDGVLNAMEEQKRGSGQILQAIGRVSDITHSVKNDAQQMMERQQVAMREANVHTP